MRSSSFSRACRSALGVTFLMLLTAASTSDPSFPKVSRGIWHLSATRTLPDGTKQTWTLTARRCQEPSLLFKGYWGLGVVDRAGCRHTPTKLSEGRFKVATECMIRNVGVATSESTISVKGDEFEMEVEVHEGDREYRATQVGKRVGPCPKGK
jgi:hypothetical protein